jgi:hypothetical protein
MTDVDEEGGQSVPEAISTHYLSTVADAIDHVRAADLLGFGVRLHSYLVPSEDGSYSERWELELLAESPVRADDDEGEG